MAQMHKSRIYARRSRVHQLARMDLLDLIAVHEKLMDLTGRAQGMNRIPPYGWDRDRTIAWIREMEDPK